MIKNILAVIGGLTVIGAVYEALKLKRETDKVNVDNIDIDSIVKKVFDDKINNKPAS